MTHGEQIGVHNSEQASEQIGVHNSEQASEQIGDRGNIYGSDGLGQWCIAERRPSSVYTKKNHNI